MLSLVVKNPLLSKRDISDLTSSLNTAKTDNSLDFMECFLFRKGRKVINEILPLVLSLGTTEKSLAPSAYTPSSWNLVCSRKIKHNCATRQVTYLFRHLALSLFCISFKPPSIRPIFSCIDINSFSPQHLKTTFLHINEITWIPRFLSLY